MKNFSNIFKRTFILMIALVTLLSFCSVTCAAWWGTPGYEWCRVNNITSIMTQSKMNESVYEGDFYAVLLNYLKIKGVERDISKYMPLDNIGNTLRTNSALVGMMDDIYNRLLIEDLTPLAYRQVMTYIEHAERTVEAQQEYLTKEEIRAFNLYLSLSKYKAATRIDDAALRIQETISNGNVKYKEIVYYNVNPFFGKITRGEFLLMMFYLMTDLNLEKDPIKDEDIFQLYRSAGVLQGYEYEEMLDKELTYAEMFTFLYRFEIFDFNPSENE